MRVAFSQSYYVYIFSFRGKLKTGITVNLQMRMNQHRRELMSASSTLERACLLYYEAYTDQHAALKREEELKEYSRKKKGALINLRNPVWANLNHVPDPGEVCNAFLKNAEDR